MSRYLTVKQAKAEFNISKSEVYRRLHSGDLEAIKLGKTSLISTASLERFIAGLPAWSPLSKQALPG